MDMHKFAEPATETIYICPRTGQSLDRHGDELRDKDGRVSYRVRDGVSHFIEAQAIDNGRGEGLQRINELAPLIGWKQALLEVLGEKSSHYLYTTQEQRTAFLNLLPITPESHVLEIGASMGQIVSEIGHRAKKVEAIEIDPEQARFAAERCRQEGHDNVAVSCGGDNCKLPYRDGSFDFVVLNLVLEWCANTEIDDIFDGDHFGAGQRRMLQECFRVLKPGGQFYVHTKNRFALRYLLGGRDEHAAGMRFGNALPRWLFRQMLRSKGVSNFRGILYSYSKLREMLLDQGFIDPKSFWATPDFRYPDIYTPTDSQSIRSARRQPGFVQDVGRKTRFLMALLPASFVKHFASSLMFVVTKP